MPLSKQVADLTKLRYNEAKDGHASLILDDSALKALQEDP